MAMLALISVTSASVANIWTSIGALTLPSAIAIAPPSRRIVSAPLDERRGVQADPGLGLERVGVAGDQVQHRRGERRGERELGEVEERA